jgi:hypothetical protein
VPIVHLFDPVADVLPLRLWALRRWVPRRWGSALISVGDLDARLNASAPVCRKRLAKSQTEEEREQSVLLSGVDEVDRNRPGKEEAATREDALDDRGMQSFSENPVEEVELVRQLGVGIVMSSSRHLGW